jgi:hypothetical protein
MTNYLSLLEFTPYIGFNFEGDFSKEILIDYNAQTTAINFVTGNATFGIGYVRSGSHQSYMFRQPDLSRYILVYNEDVRYNYVPIWDFKGMDPSGTLTYSSSGQIDSSAWIRTQTGYYRETNSTDFQMDVSMSLMNNYGYNTNVDAYPKSAYIGAYLDTSTWAVYEQLTTIAINAIENLI